MNGKEAESTSVPGSRWLLRLTLALLLLAIVVLAREALPQTVGEKARQVFLDKLRRGYPDLDVRIAQGRYEPEVGFVFEDLVIRDPETADGWRPRTLAKIRQLVVFTDVDLNKVLDRQNPLETRRVVADGVTLNVWPEDRDRWSPEKLLPIPSFGPECPRIDVRDAKIVLVDPSGHVADLSIHVGHAIMRTQQGGAGETATKQIQLHAASHFVDSINAEMTLAGNQVNASFRVEDLRINGDLLRHVPDPFEAQLADLMGLDCKLGIDGRVATGASGEVDFQIHTTVADATFAHAKLPLSITDLQAAVEITPSQVTVHRSSGSLCDARCSASGVVMGLDWPSDAMFDVRAEGLLLDQRLAGVLPSKLQPLWEKLKPSGHLDIDANVSHRGGRWTTQADLDCKGVDIRYDKFPYPAKQLTGQVRIADGRAIAESMTGLVGGQPFHCDFDLPASPGPKQPMRFRCQTKGPIAIDETLMESLSPRGEPDTKLETFVRQLAPAGLVGVQSVFLERGDDGVLRRDMDLLIADGRLRYSKFNYPLFNVHGGIRVKDQRIELIGFRANTASSGTVQCQGRFVMPPPPTVHPNATPIPGIPARIDRGSSSLELMFTALDLPMDGTLQSSLPESVKSIWTSLSPSGVLDQARVKVSKNGDRPLKLEMTAQQQRTASVESRTLSLRPQALPYRLDITGGSVHYKDDKVVIRNMVGRHGESVLSANGSCHKSPSQRWLLSLQWLGGSRLLPDSELVASLPDIVASGMRQIQLRGPISVRGTTHVHLANNQFADPLIQWDLTMQLEGNRIGDAGPVHSIRGEIYSVGQHDGANLLVDGRVLVDSMHFQDLQITNLRGPYSIQDDAMRLGAEIGQGQSIQGNVFDGSILLDGVTMLTTGEFDVGLQVRAAKVPTLLADLGHSDQDLTGQLDGMTRLVGVLGDFERLQGTGEARMSGANIYQLPFIIQIFNQLRITPTEDVAITDGNCVFGLDGQDVNVSKLTLWGDLVALHGGGKVLRGRELDLTFDTRVSPQNIFTRVIGPLREKPYRLWTIDVTGPIGSQTIERRTLDSFGDTLDSLFAGRDSDASAILSQQYSNSATKARLQFEASETRSASRRGYFSKNFSKN